MHNKVLLLILLSSCSTHGPWTLDKISSGNTIFDLSRLTYQNTQEMSPLRLELIKMGQQFDLILSLADSTIALRSQDEATLRFKIGHEPPFQESVPIYQGSMRMHLSTKTAEKIIKGLQEGLRIDIVVNEVEGSISPDQFAKNYEKFMKKGFFK